MLSLLFRIDVAAARVFWLITGLPPHHNPYQRASNGCSKKEDLAFTPQYAALASRARAGCLCGMPELR